MRGLVGLLAWMMVEEILEAGGEGRHKYEIRKDETRSKRGEDTITTIYFYDSDTHRGLMSQVRGE